MGSEGLSEIKTLVTTVSSTRVSTDEQVRDLARAASFRDLMEPFEDSGLNSHEDKDEEGVGLEDLPRSLTSSVPEIY